MYKETKCKTCGTSKETLYCLPKMRDGKDYFCKSCKEEAR